MALLLSLSLISTPFITNAQLDSYHQLTYPDELYLADCNMIYDTRNLNNLGPHGSGVCAAPMPCPCLGSSFSSFLLEETTTNIGFNLTDHSSLDFTILLDDDYLLWSIKFQWQYKNSPINQAKSNVSLYDIGLEDWVPHDIKYSPVDASGSAIRVNATI
eukprot:496176_1